MVSSWFRETERVESEYILYNYSLAWQPYVTDKSAIERGNSILVLWNMDKTVGTEDASV